MERAEQRQIELLEAESSQRQHHEVQIHYENMFYASERTQYNKFAMLKPELKKDGILFIGTFKSGKTVILKGKINS